MKETLSIPHDIEAEQAVIGMIIEDNACFLDVSDILAPELFFKTAHQHIFRAIIDLDTKKIQFDPITIGDALKSMGRLEEIGGYAYLYELQDLSPMEGNIRLYAFYIQEHAQARYLIDICSDISGKARDREQNITELISEAESKIIEIGECFHGSDTVHIKYALESKFKQLEKLSLKKYEDPDYLPGVETGFIDLDRILSGLIPGNLITIAARPGMGKSALAFNIAQHVAKYSKKYVLVYSLEMTKEQMASRMLAGEEKVEASKLKTGSLEQNDWDKLAMATDRLSSSNMMVNDRLIDIDQIVFDARRIDKRIGIELLIVDYAQLAKSFGRSREEEVSSISRKLKWISKELEIPVVQLAQLNRKCEERKDKRPILSDLRESGGIEQDSDVVLFIYRDEIYDQNTNDKGIAEIIIPKHRDGPTGTIRLAYISKYVKFSNLSQISYPYDV